MSLNNLNSVLIEGVFKKDPVLRESAKGASLCKFELINRRYYGKDMKYSEDMACPEDAEAEVSYITIEATGKLAKSVYRLGHKDRGARVVGRIKEERWIDADGKEKSRLIVVAEHVEMRPEGLVGPEGITKPKKKQGKKE
jgi:single-strand DNA-binding protein